jgi:hypothetical protein
MNGLNGVGGLGGRSSGSLPRRENAASSATVSSGRALVPVRPIGRSENSAAPGRHPAATFLAHLIATTQGEPQTRDRRRATPLEATTAYAASANLTAPGGDLSRLS